MTTAEAGVLGRRQIAGPQAPAAKRSSFSIAAQRRLVTEWTLLIKPSRCTAQANMRVGRPAFQPFLGPNKCRSKSKCRVEIFSSLSAVMSQTPACPASFLKYPVISVSGRSQPSKMVFLDLAIPGAPTSPYRSSPACPTSLNILD